MDVPLDNLRVLEGCCWPDNQNAAFMLYRSKLEDGVRGRGPWTSSIRVTWELLEMPDLRLQSWSMETGCILTRSPGDLYAHYCLRSSAIEFMVNKVLSNKLFICGGRGNRGFEVNDLPKVTWLELGISCLLWFGALSTVSLCLLATVKREY